MTKEIVLYFSVYGTTKKIAEELGSQTGADLVEIEPFVPYDSNQDHYNDLANFTRKEYENNTRPSIKNHIDISAYDTVFLGYPIWWYTFPMILYTLFEQLDFFGKTIIPFNTHMGSKDGGTYRTIRKLEPNATVSEGLYFSMKEAESGSPEKVHSWLKKLNDQSFTFGG